MTIEGAIKHCEEVAKEQDKLCKRYDDASGYSRYHDEAIRTTDAKRCEGCAEEHRQLAEWLKDYKRLLEQEPCEDCISREKTLKVMIEQLGIRNEDYLLPAEATLYRVVKNMPPVTPQPKTGQWVDDKCSVCGKGIEDLIESSEWYWNESPKYCPFCGIKIQPYKAESEE